MRRMTGKQLNEECASLAGDRRDDMYCKSRRIPHNMSTNDRSEYSYNRNISHSYFYTMMLLHCIEPKVEDNSTVDKPAVPTSCQVIETSTCILYVVNCIKSHNINCKKVCFVIEVIYFQQSIIFVCRIVINAAVTQLFKKMFYYYI